MNNRLNLTIAGILVVLAALSRVMLFPDHNFSPIIGMALFAGAVFSDKRYAFALPVFSMLLSDVLFEVSGIAPGFWGVGQLVNYAVLFLVTGIGFGLKNFNVLKIGVFSIASSLVFFALSNLGFFLFENPIYHLYPQTMDGFVKCYIAAVPFLKNSLVADLVFSFALFGTYYFTNKQIFAKAATV